MAFSGGTYTLPAGNPVTTLTTIDSSWANTTLSDIATALTTCVLKDGTQTLTANLPMSGFKLTGLAAGSSANDSVRLTQLQNNTASYLTGTAGTNTVTASASPTLTSLVAGQRFALIPANTNTGATTLQIDSTAATNVFWNGAALVGGEIRQSVPIEVMYDGTQYQLLASASMANVYAIPDVMRLQSAGDRTKQMIFNVSGVATSSTVTMTVPATGGTIAIQAFVTGYQASVSGPTLVVFSGSGTWTKPSGLKSIFVEVYGGGGNGGAATVGGGASSAGGGGGGGGYSKKRVVAATLGATEQVSVAGAGTTASFGAHASATGGQNGNAGGADTGGSGGVGGVGSSGDVNTNGGTGMGAFPANGTPIVSSGMGSNSPLGGGGDLRTASAAGSAATGKAAGGSGAYATSGSQSGGTGSGGLVIVSEFY